MKGSVVIITRDRPHLIGPTLESLCTQTRPPDEVVVVINASKMSYEEVLAPYLQRLPLRVVREEVPGLPSARNCGWREARFDVVLFTDDDCRVEPGWVEAMMAPFERDPHIGVVGGEILGEVGDGGLADEFSRLESNLSLGRREKKRS